MGQIRRIVKRSASLGLAIMLLAMGAFTIWATASTEQLANQVNNSVRLDSAYQQIHAAFAVQMASEQQMAHQALLQDSLTASERQQSVTIFNQGDADLAHAMAVLSNSVDHDDRSFAATMIMARQQNRQGFNQLLNYLNSGDIGKGSDLLDNNLGPAIGTIDARSVRMSQAEAAELLSNLNRMRHQTAAIATNSIIGFTIAIIVLVMFSLIGNRFQRRLDLLRQEEMARLAQAARTDSLTGLGNHRGYQDALEQAVQQAVLLPHRVILAFIDVDDFKIVNDHNGHMFGDRILSMLATMLRDCAGEQMAFRRGGDEFAMIIQATNLESLDSLHTRLNTLCQEARRQLQNVTVSIGYATLLSGERDITPLQERADAALYEAKRQGRNTVVAYDPERDASSISSSAKVHAVRLLLGEGQVNVAFQPICDLASQRVLAYEALTRPAPEYGLQGPQEAFDVAERMGRAHELDALCRRAILKRASSELPDEVLLFINISPQSLDHHAITGDLLKSELAEVGLSAERIVLELTERAIVRPEVLAREVRGLHQSGFRLALDDTGAGNAGLELLSQVPVDFVKIDRAVVQRAATDHAARAVLAGVTAIARETGSYLIAEGIEDVEMLDLVRRAGVDGVQGYLLGRPSAHALPSHVLESLTETLRAA